MEPHSFVNGQSTNDGGKKKGRIAQILEAKVRGRICFFNSRPPFPKRNSAVWPVLYHSLNKTLNCPPASWFEMAPKYFSRSHGTSSNALVHNPLGLLHKTPYLLRITSRREVNYGLEIKRNLHCFKIPSNWSYHPPPPTHTYTTSTTGMRITRPP